MCIVTGPGIDLAIALIDRMKKMFAGSNKGLISFDTKETVIELNNAKIEAFPSHHLDAMRGLPNVSFILLDEADFFPPGQQQDARDVSERYIAKSRYCNGINVLMHLMVCLRYLFIQKNIPRLYLWYW